MPGFADDWIAFPHPVGLIEDLRALFLEREIPEPCFMGVLPGDTVALDWINDECGAMSYARVGSVFPAANFPEQDTTPSRIIQLAVAVELGTFRAVPIPDDGEPPTYDEYYEVTRLQMADMKAMLNVLCSYADAHELPILIGSYTPLGPDGGAVGGSWLCTLGAR